MARIMPGPTRRLYRDDSYLTGFTARVTGCTPHGQGRLAVTLDRTAFYPTGGGQPHDTGSLAGNAVLDVVEGDQGSILHVVRRDQPLAGDIEGVVDWPRRFDHMQQHSGQHILSRAFVAVAGAATTSFHLGERSCTIDIELARAGEEIIRNAERLANETIFADVPVEVLHTEPGRPGGPAAGPGVQRELALKPGDPIRLIRIGAFDETPCGGTHVRRSGEVGSVAIRSWEPFKGGTRVVFLCGGRVVRAVAGLGGVVDSLVARLSAQPHELPAAVARLQEQLAGARREAKTLGEALAGAEAVARDATARQAGGARVLVELFDGRPVEELQSLAGRYAATPGHAALLAATDTATGRATLVFARAPEGMPGAPRMGDLLREVCSARGGKGGGGETLARGGVPAAEAGAALEQAFELLRARLSS